METALIVLNYNDYVTTQKLLENVKGINRINKIIVVDNFSTDQSFNELQKYKSDKIDVIKTEKNGGYAYGNNYGIQYAVKHYSPEYLFIANPDIELNNQIIQGILDFYRRKKENNEKTGIVTGKMITTSDINIQSAWRLPEYADCIWENLLVLRKILHIRGNAYAENYFDREISNVDVINGSFFSIQSKTFFDVGMLDEETFLYGEENILAFKLKAKGYKNYVLNRYEYLHHHSVSISKSIKSVGKKLDLAYESRVLYLEKYLKIGRVKKFFHKITYKIGKMNYLLLKNILKIFKSGKREI